MTSTLRPPLSADDHVVGDESALVTLVEYGDYECPFCGQAAVVVAALRETLGDQLRYGFRHFPLATVHPHALQAAEAAEAAGAQGRFWPMHDRLYANQDALELPDLLEHAAALGLDVERFAGDLDSHRFLEKIRAHLRSGAISGVNGTPTFFINGQRHDGSWDYESLYVGLVRAARGELVEEPIVP
ncbi:MAG: cyclic nucleotide-binding protein [bacterium]|nr:cyclic nucleotide-binding protein [bacterium]